MGCFKLKDCTTNYWVFYVADNTHSLADSLYNFDFVNGTIIKVTIPTALSGFLYDVTSCFRLTWEPDDTICNSPGYYDLGVVTDYGVVGCLNCSKVVTVTKCFSNPLEVIAFYTSDLSIVNFNNDCKRSCFGCATSVYIDAPGSPISPGCWEIKGIPTNDAFNLDFYNPSFDLTCSNTPCIACSSTCYLVEVCNSNSFIISNPTGTPLVLDLIIDAVVTISPPNSDEIVYDGCMIIKELDTCGPLDFGDSIIYPIFDPVDVQIDNPGVSYSDCSKCYADRGYIITRCDDPSISFVVSNDLSTIVGSVITNVKIINCNSTVSICSSVKDEQCWKVGPWPDPGTFIIQYTDVLPNCDCCPGPCD